MKDLLAFLSSVMVDSTANAPLFDYTRLLESTDDWRHMFGLVIQESEKDLIELETALKKNDCEAMRRIVHRMMPAWELLEADAMLSDYRKTLHDRTSDTRAIREHTLKIMEYIRELINETKHELERKDNGKETEPVDSGGQPDSQ